MHVLDINKARLNARQRRRAAENYGLVLEFVGRRIRNGQCPYSERDTLLGIAHMAMCRAAKTFVQGQSDFASFAWGWMCRYWRQFLAAQYKRPLLVADLPEAAPEQGRCDHRFAQIDLAHDLARMTVRAKLAPTEREALIGYYLAGHTLTEMAGKAKVSRQTMANRRDRALNKMALIAE